MGRPAAHRRLSAAFLATFPQFSAAIINPPKRINALSLCAEKRWHNHPRQLPRAILNALDTHDAAEPEGNDLRLLVVRHE